MPGTAIEEYNLEIAGRVGDTAFHVGSGVVKATRNPVKVLALCPFGWMSWGLPSRRATAGLCRRSTWSEQSSSSVKILVAGSGTMSRSNPLLWPKPPAIWSYGISVLSVAAALAISRLPAVHLQDAPVSLFLCAVILSAWFGGVGPGLLATTLSALAFNYYFLPPTHSLGPKPDEIPRLVIFTVSALFVGSLSAAERSAIRSLRRARDDLRKTVQELQSTNEALQAESLERKHAEEARREAQAELERVSRVTTMGELTASLAHEVNQPIAAAVTNANTCLRWLTRDHPDVEEARAAAMRIVKDGTRAAEIVKRIRQLFKKSAPQRELVDLNEAIREMIVLSRSEATRHNITVRMELAVDLPGIMGDRVQLQQVLMNLMVNGIDAMKEVDGTRELALKSQRTEKEEVLVSVSDTGAGLPPQQTDQIFNAFFTTKPHGTGMGLRISRSIVESHGGRLWAGNNSPRGASFHFALPTKIEAKE
jgi:signal transduction histidine kinase